MTADEWTQSVVVDNEGEPLTVWKWREYETAQEVNLGLLGGWVFLLKQGRNELGLFHDLETAQARATELECATACDESEAESLDPPRLYALEEEDAA